MIILDIILLMLIKPTLLLLFGWWHFHASKTFSASYRHLGLVTILLLLPLLATSNLWLPSWDFALQDSHSFLSWSITDVWQQPLFVGLLSIYLFGALWKLFYLLLGLAALNHQQHYSYPNRKLQGITDELARMTGIKRRVQLHLNPSCDMPYVWGIIKPTLVLPVNAQHWQADQQRLIILHELGHVARFDWLLTLWVKIVCSLFWFLPVINHLHSLLDDMTERACDDWVLSQGEDCPEYAALLTHIGQSLKSNQDLPATFIDGSHGSSHYQRIVALLDDFSDHEPRSRSDWLRAVGIGVLWLAPLSIMHANVSITPPSIEHINVQFWSAETNSHSQTKTQSISWQRPQVVDIHQQPAMEELFVVNEIPEFAPLTNNLGATNLSATNKININLNPQVLIEGFLPTRTVLPIYPKRAIKRGIEGKVIVQFTIDNHGQTQQPRIVHSQPSGIFDKAVLEALQQFRFKPHTVNGEATSVSGITEEFVFQLSDHPPPTRRQHQPVTGQTAIALQH